MYVIQFGTEGHSSWGGIADEAEPWTLIIFCLSSHHEGHLVFLHSFDGALSVHFPL